ncbi:5693_t:CDS:2 [Entrophospora sp. SA101]|nr:5693_t:CDS:2 [Entrophospora sp. SA101]
MKTSSEPLLLIEQENNVPIPLSNKALEVKQKLINKINSLPEKQIFACSTLLEIMVYPDDSSATGIQNKIKLLKSENEKLTKKIESATSKKRTLAIKLKKQEQNRDLYISRMRSLVSKRKNLKKNLEEGRSDSFGLFEALEQYDPTPLDFEITKEKLTAIRMKRRKETSLSTDLAVGEEAAKKLAQSFLIPRRN